MGQFRLYRCKGMQRYCCVTYRLQPGVKNVYKKIGQKPSRGQIEKSQEISVFIVLSCWISPSNGNLLSRPNGTQTLILSTLSLISSYAIIERQVVPFL